MKAYRQRGFALIAVIALVAMMSAYLIANALNRTRYEVATERDQQTALALQQAKAVLIAKAADMNAKQPGALACPDHDNDGDEDCTWGSNLASTIGRLPWKSLGLGDIRDGTGERLWYAVSHSFRKLSGITVVNSDTQGQLRVKDWNGNVVASDVVAVIVAPGDPVTDPSTGTLQDRSTDNVNRVLSYIEGFSSQDGIHFEFTMRAPHSITENDRIAFITRSELMAVVEPVVAARIERDIKPFIETYRKEWGAYPFPAPFVNPGNNDPSDAANYRPQSRYDGSSSEVAGLLPVTRAVSYPWTDGTVSQISSDLGSVSGSCPIPSGTDLECTLTFQPEIMKIFGFQISRIRNVRFQIQAKAGEAVPRSFAKLPDVSTVTAETGSAAVTLNEMSMKGSVTLNPGVGTVTFAGTYSPSCGWFCPVTTVVLRIPGVTVSAMTDPADSTAGWFISNEWYRQIYYAVAVGWLPGYGGACPSSSPAHPAVPPPYPCLAVTDLGPAHSGAADKQAILILAGEAYPGVTRPSTDIGAYLEGQNASAGDWTFQHRQGTPTTINDRVVVLGVEVPAP